MKCFSKYKSTASHKLQVFNDGLLPLYFSQGQRYYFSLKAEAKLFEIMNRKQQ